MDDGDTQYKIGITNPSEKRHFPNADLACICIVKTWHFEIGVEAAKRELEILQRFVRHRYSGPDILVGAGNTELFTHDVLGLVKGGSEHGQSVVDAEANLISRHIQLEIDFGWT